MKEYYLKVHNVDSKTIVTVCDKDLLGKEFREGDIVLKVEEPFYGGKLADLEEVINAILSADIVVLTGSKLIEELSKRGLIPKDFALRVGDQLHIQIVREV